MKLPWLTFAAVGLLNAAVLRAEDPAGIDITSGRMETITKGTETTTTFHDDVVLIDGNLRVTGDFLEVLVDSQGQGAPASGQPASFKSILVTGNVHIYRGTDIATCGRAEILQHAGTIVLTDHPVLRRTENNSSVEPGPHGTIIYYFRERRVEAVPDPGERNHFVLPSVKALDLVPGAKPAAAPAPAPTP
jgi:lipopolysaccharide export system protein LptA